MFKPNCDIKIKKCVIYNIKLVNAGFRNLYLCEYAQYINKKNITSIKFIQVSMGLIIFYRDSISIIDDIDLGKQLGYIYPSNDYENLPALIGYIVNGVILYCQKIPYPTIDILNKIYRDCEKINNILGYEVGLHLII